MDSKLHRVNPILGLNQPEFFNVLSGLGDSVASYGRNRYTNYFRPPLSSSEPTVANVSLISPHVEIQPDKTLSLRVKFVREYVDSRLEFDDKLLPSSSSLGVNRRFIEFPSELYHVRLWGPTINVVRPEEAFVGVHSKYELEGERRPARVLVTPQGKVYNSQTAVFKLKPVNLDTKSEEDPLEYRLVLSEDKETVESLKLLWNSSKALVDSLESLKHLKTTEGDKTHKVESISVSCTDGKSRTEELGGEFGAMTFSVLELTISLKLEKENKKDEEKTEA